MTRLPCRELKCTMCCQWGVQADLIKPSIELNTHPNGDCKYLIRGIGCMVYGGKLRPPECEAFSCVEFLSRVEADANLQPMTAVIVSAVKMREHVKKGVIIT